MEGKEDAVSVAFKPHPIYSRPRTMQPPIMPSYRFSHIYYPHKYSSYSERDKVSDNDDPGKDDEDRYHLRDDEDHDPEQTELDLRLPSKQRRKSQSPLLSSEYYGMKQDRRTSTPEDLSPRGGSESVSHKERVHGTRNVEEGLPEDLSAKSSQPSPRKDRTEVEDGEEDDDDDNDGVAASARERTILEEEGMMGDIGGVDRRVQAEWSYEEQFKQLYELSDSPQRKEFLDDLFCFMQKRGTPVNRIPIMAKQVLDLYELFNLVVAKGGLVEVINKKQWREITKGLNLPASITSAAFTLRTQYMKYLYPYECEKKNLSSPAELQAAIDGNRREGRRPSFHQGHPLAYIPHMSPASPSPTMIPHPSRIPVAPPMSSPGGSPLMQHSDEEGSGPTSHSSRKRSPSHNSFLDQEGRLPPSKRPYLTDDHHRYLFQHPLMSSAHIKLSSQRAHPDTGFPLLELRGDNSIVVSIELNGVLYQGVLYPRGVPGHPLHAFSARGPVVTP